MHGDMQGQIALLKKEAIQAADAHASTLDALGSLQNYSRSLIAELAHRAATVAELRQEVAADHQAQARAREAADTQAATAASALKRAEVRLCNSHMSIDLQCGLYIKALRELFSSA